MNALHNGHGLALSQNAKVAERRYLRKDERPGDRDT
jgi:hypothetical protein